VLIVVLAVAGLGILAAFRSGARSGHRLARHSQEVTRMGGNLLRALATAAVIIAVQWAVVRFTSDARAWGVALGHPRLVRRRRDRPDVLRHRDHPAAHPQAGSPMTSQRPPRAETSLSVAAQTREIAPVEPVYDGEVGGDLPRAVRRAVIRRFVNWWSR
jgi:hypothetical protein